MSNDAKFTILVTVLLFIAGGMGTLGVYVIRGAARWGRTEERLSELVDDVKSLINSKDVVHERMYAQMREDRQATDKRLRWLEERMWGSGATRNRT